MKCAKEEKEHKRTEPSNVSFHVNVLPGMQPIKAKLQK